MEESKCWPHFFLISNNSEIGLGCRSLPLVPVSISCTCKQELNFHASTEIYSVRVKWILLLEIVQVEYFFLNKFKVNFHAVLLILRVFQVDMIYMYHNSGVVYKCSQLTYIISKWNSTSIQWQANGSNTYFFLISLLGAKRLLYMKCKDKENTICQQFHWLFPKFCLCIISD